ncbi:sulfatase-like hydrolase/transferase [Rubritalea spongiae]|uniref:Sulfatase-like hydrolase/transferase n=1 Tax=Rubritalea spongiae TaxID=430797 RepID=A0ABW5E610_9BACT
MKTYLIPLGLIASFASLSAQIKVAIHETNAIAAGMSSRPDGTVVTSSTETWNNAIGQTGSSIILSDTSGSATTASLSYNAGFIKSNTLGWESQSQDWVMMGTWIGFKQNESLTISNLPASYASGYSIVIYGDSNDGGTRTMDYFIDDGTNTKTATILDSAYFNGTFSNDKTVVITGLTGNSFTLTGNPNSSDSRSAICGLEIISLTTPFISSFEADPNYIQPGSSTTLSWSTFNSTHLTLNPGNINVTGSSSYSVSPNSSTTYSLTASDSTDNSSRQLTVHVGPERPNVLIFLIDDYGSMDTSVPFAYDQYNYSGTPLITAFNHFYKTPHIASLAANGMKFTQAYAMPMCSPTRVSLMTGQNSPRHGVTVHLNAYQTVDNKSFSIKTHRGPNNWRYLGMDGTDVTLPQLLKDTGYHTFLIGKDHMSHQQNPTAIGFDVSDDGLVKAPVMTSKTNAALENAVTLGNPFFAYVSYRDVHTAFYNATDAIGDYSDAYNTNHAKFATMVESVDNSVGAIMAKLTELGVAENTLVFFLGDNGSDSPALSDEGWPRGIFFDDFPMRGKKGSAYEGGIRVPLIITWATPDSNNSLQQTLPIPAASVEHDMVTVEDLAPTILSLVEQSSPTMDGYDLTPYLRTEAGTHRPQKILRHMPHEHRSNYFTCYRESDWKIIYRYHIEESIANSETHEDSAYESFELYNLASDPNESENLASSNPEQLLKMARAMAQELNNSWGSHGELWPAHNPTLAEKPTRNLIDDPFFIDFNIGSRSLVDSDLDGLTDQQEDLDANGLLGLTETSADNPDTDTDNTDDYAETRLGLDPLDPNERFRVSSIVQSNGSITLTWPSSPGLSFDLHSSLDLSSPTSSWNIHTPNLPADLSESETTINIPITADRKFFSVELKP